MSERISEAEIQRLLTEATPGPWLVRYAHSGGDVGIYRPSDANVLAECFDEFEQEGVHRPHIASANAALIAAAPDVIAQQARDIEVLRDALEGAAHNGGWRGTPCTKSRIVKNADWCSVHGGGWPCWVGKAKLALEATE